MRIYIASKTKHAPAWLSLVRTWSYNSKPINIISSWIREAGPGMTASRPELAERCMREAASADRLILYSEPGEVLEGALVEAGACLASGGEVVVVGPVCLGTVLTEHPHVRRSESFGDAVAMKAFR